MTTKIVEAWVSWTAHFNVWYNILVFKLYICTSKIFSTTHFNSALKCPFSHPKKTTTTECLAIKKNNSQLAVGEN